MRESMEKPESVQAETPQEREQEREQEQEQEQEQTSQEQTSNDAQAESTSEQTADQAEQQAGETEETEGDIAVLQAELEEKAAEAQANYDLFVRERAELENFKRRMQREKSESLRFAVEPLVRDILPVVDNLERAVKHTEGNENGQALVEGVELVLRSFLEALEKHGVCRMKAKDEIFDPTKHQAVAQVENAQLTPNTVVDEHQPGYQLHERLLRPAMVTVSKAPPSPHSQEEEKSES